MGRGTIIRRETSLVGVSPFTDTRNVPSIRTFFEDAEGRFLEGKLVILLKLETCSDLNRDVRSEIWSSIGP